MDFCRIYYLTSASVTAAKARKHKLHHQCKTANILESFIKRTSGSAINLCHIFTA